MPILSSIQTPFGSELSLSSLLSIEETIRKRVEKANVENKSHDTIDTASCSEGTFSSLEAEDPMPKSIMRNAKNCESFECNDDEPLKSWIEQPIPSPTPSSPRRRRITSQSSPNKYDCVKTRYPGREGRRRRQEPRVRAPRTEKTVEEQWVRTCRFLW